MRAWLLESLTGVGNMVLGEIPDPHPGPGEVLLKIRFAGLNPADAFLSQGLYPAKPPLPHILGRDAVGQIVELGPDVKDLKLGDTVGVLRCDIGVKVWGTLAEKTVVPVASVAPVPQGWTIEEMAGAPLTFLTAFQALTQWSDPPAPPREGSVLLVTGASGGVGVAAVLLGKSMSLKVVALTRSAQKGARLKELGADFVFDPQDPALAKNIKTALAPAAVDLAIDNVGGALFSQVVATLAYAGKISVVGRSAGPVPDFNTGTLFFRRNRIGGVAVGDYTPESAQIDWNKIVGRLHAANRKPVVDRIFPFEDVKAAFARLAEGPMGKVLVNVAG